MDPRMEREKLNMVQDVRLQRVCLYIGYLLELQKTPQRGEQQVATLNALADCTVTPREVSPEHDPEVRITSG